MKTELAVISILSEHDGLTINAISKLLGKPYATINKYVHELIKKKIISQQKIGNAIYCTLNNTEEVLGWLVLLSMQTAQKVLEKLSPDENKKLFESNESQIVILEDGRAKAIHDSQARPGMITLRNHERYWRAVR